MKHIYRIMLVLGLFVVSGALHAAQMTGRHIRISAPAQVKGVHVSAWVAGDQKKRAIIDSLLAETELNTVVIDIKETEGQVYLPGFKPADEMKTFTAAMPDIETYLADLKARKVYTVARIVCFCDNLLAERKPEWAIKDGTSTWRNMYNLGWGDPYRREVREYNLQLAEYAADFGFDEIQFDYIRFPTDGMVSSCTYSQQYSTGTAVAAITGFLKEAHQRLKPKGVKISIDVFGYTLTSNDLSIGQKVTEMAAFTDYVCPMIYPSHYTKGEFGLEDPDSEPYHTISAALGGGIKLLGANSGKLRPYLQDFSRRKTYGPKDVRDQIDAAADHGVNDWLLWNVNCEYTRSALKNKGN